MYNQPPPNNQAAGYPPYGQDPNQGQTVVKQTTTTYYYPQSTAPPQEADHHPLISQQSQNQYESEYPQQREYHSLKTHGATRIGFVRKVYGILTFQLAITALMVFMAVAPKIYPHGEFAKNSMLNTYHNMLHSEGIQMGMLVGYIGSICALACCGFDKTVPINYVFLCIFTFCTGWIVSISTLHVKPIIVLEAACLTLAMVFAITLYAMTTTTDFTVFGPLLWIFGMVFGVAGIFLSMFGFTKGLLWSTIGVVLFSFYLLYDTQMIMGGDNKSVQYDEDCYILAAINLYLDIINIFLYILNILGDMDR